MRQSPKRSSTNPFRIVESGAKQIARLMSMLPRATSMQSMACLLCRNRTLSPTLTTRSVNHLPVRVYVHFGAAPASQLAFCCAAHPATYRRRFCSLLRSKVYGRRFLAPSPSLSFFAVPASCAVLCASRLVALRGDALSEKVSSGQSAQIRIAVKDGRRAQTHK